jgi:hypothetical protein
MGCERDEVTLIQVFLLLSFWFETLAEEKNTRHWMALASSLCVTADFNQTPAIDSVSKQQLKKRIWWSCFVRDQLVALLYIFFIERMSDGHVSV